MGWRGALQAGALTPEDSNKYTALPRRAATEMQEITRYCSETMGGRDKLGEVVAHGARRISEWSGRRGRVMQLAIVSP